MGVSCAQKLDPPPSPSCGSEIHIWRENLRDAKGFSFSPQGRAWQRRRNRGGRCRGRGGTCNKWAGSKHRPSPCRPTKWIGATAQTCLFSKNKPICPLTVPKFGDRSCKHGGCQSHAGGDGGDKVRGPRALPVASPHFDQLSPTSSRRRLPFAPLGGRPLPPGGGGRIGDRGPRPSRAAALGKQCGRRTEAQPTRPRGGGRPICSSEPRATARR